MITKSEESVGYLFEMEKKHKNHPAMGPKGTGGSTGSIGDVSQAVKKLHDGKYTVSVNENIVEIALRPKLERASGSVYAPGNDQYTQSSQKAKGAAVKIKEHVDKTYKPEDSWIEPDGLRVGFVSDAFLGSKVTRING